MKKLILHIARKQFRVITRGGLFRFSLLFVCIVIFGLQLFFQGDYFKLSLTGLSTMESFVPYENQYLYVIIETFLLFFLICSLGSAERKLDSMAAIYSRPESNGELLGGYFMAFVASALLGAFVVCVAGMFVHVFFSLTPFAFLPYLFYLFTLTFPAFVFYTGLTFLVLVVVKEQFLTLLVVVAVFFLNLRYADGVAGGAFDPLGIFLPNAFSNIMGHPDVLPYLVQRAGWFCVGVGCLGGAIRLFDRLPNRPKRGVCLSLIFMFLGGVCVFSFYRGYRVDRDTREIYREAYVRYAGRDYLTVKRCDVRLHHEGEEISCEARLTLRNESGKDIDEVLLYLNPALEVLSVREGGVEIGTARDNQVVRLDRGVAKGDSLGIAVVYAGGIDERVCYLDVPDEQYRDPAARQFLTCRFGKHDVFLGRDYVLLLPECLWYPSSRPVVNPGAAYDVMFPFADYTLEVSGFGKCKVVSQGKRTKVGDKVKFVPEYPLQGISLCMGDYSVFGTTVDSVRYEVYVFRENVEILKGLSHVNLRGPIRELRKVMEERQLCSFPYARFVMIESPLSFSSYYRGQRGGTEYVQPEMLFVPERGVGYWKNVPWQKRRNVEGEREFMEALRKDGVKVPNDWAQFDQLSPEKQENSIVENFLTGFLFEKYERVKGFLGDDEFRLWLPSWKRREFGRSMSTLNPYSLVPMCRERLISVADQEDHLMNLVLHYILKVEGDRMWQFARHEEYDEEAISYLNGHSLKEALSDVFLSEGVQEKILSLKTDELFQLFAYRGIQPPVLFHYIDSCFRQACFQQVDFGGLKRDFAGRYGVDWDSILPVWYGQKRLPTYLLKKFQVVPIEDEQEVSVDVVNFSMEELFRRGSQVKRRFRVNLEVYNDSEVDGLIVLADNRSEDLRDLRYYSGNYRCEVIELKAGEGKIIEKEYDDFNPGLSLGLSCNLPRAYRSNRDAREKISGTVKNSVRGAGRAYFTGEGNIHEVVVDNEDSAFRVQEKKSFHLQDFFNKGEKVYKGIFMFPDERVWKKAVEVEDNFGGKLFGTPVSTAMYKLVGDGSLSASWKAHIREAGEYEVFVYVYHMGVRGNRKEMARTKGGEKRVDSQAVLYG